MYFKDRKLNISKLQTDMSYHKYFVSYKLFNKMTIDNFYISLEPLKFGKKHANFSVSFSTPYDICFDITDLRVILNNISGVKYLFVVRFSICNE